MPEKNQAELTQEAQNQEEQEPARPILDLRSEPVQEIIGRDPNWIIRWGITVIFFTVLMLLAGTWIIKYPEIISSRISITTQRPPVRVVARSNGKIESFFVKEGDEVKADQYLALMETTASFEDMQRLRLQLERFGEFLQNPEAHLDEDWARDLELGEIQDVYSAFLAAYDSLKTYVHQDFKGAQIKALEDQIRQYRNLNQRLLSQKDLLTRELELYRRKYENHKSLFERKLISENELAEFEGQLLQKKFSLENADGNIVTNQIRIEDLQKNVLELGQQTQEQKRTLVSNARAAFKTLSSSFDRWVQQYVLQAPTDGFVTFFRFWSEKQYVAANEEVMVILPGLNELICKIHLPQTGAGRVESGQRVNIKFDSYPFKDFGMVIGKVETVSLMAQDNIYLINVSLPNGLHTTYNKELGFKYNMEGSADIITRDLRLMERIFNQFRHIFNSNV